MMLVAVSTLVLVLLAAAGAVYQARGHERDLAAFPAPGRFIEAEGRRLHIVCLGSGSPAVIFEAALAASSLSWTRVQNDVARWTTACAYDRAGFAWSDEAAQPATFARTVDGLESVAGSVGYPPPHVLVGHSLGSFICLEYARRHPDRVAGLVLVDPPSDWMNPDRRQRRMLRGGVLMSRLGGRLARIGVVRASLALLTGGAPSASRHLVKVFGPTTAGTLKRLVDEVRKLPEDLHPTVAAMWCQPKCFAAMADHIRIMPEASETVSAIRSLGHIPTVVISSGDQSADIAAAHAALARLSTRGRIVVAAKSGHWIPYDEPELIVAAVRSIVGIV